MMDWILVIVYFFLMLFAVWLLYYYFKSPFKYPYLITTYDVSRKKQPDIMDYVDDFLITKDFSLVYNQLFIIDSWKQQCLAKIPHMLFKKKRMKQYLACIDDEHAYQFYLTRRQTRYRQRNYIKTSYQVDNLSDKFGCNYQFLRERKDKLAAINYECPLNVYHAKNQRKLMTKELRQQIMERDNYTCQICGRYMPDKFGLHIDHIIPVSKGGKTIPSNLQVLCSKCNGQKSNRLPDEKSQQADT